MDDPMKRALLGVIAALGLSACADTVGYGPYLGGGTAFYDDYYGPFYNGYWGNDGFFYYSTDHGHHYARDEAHHFRHDQPGGGWHGVHTHPAWVGHHGGGAPGAGPPGGGEHHHDHH
jgi:hypothetical protein